jgi:NAD(P)H-hydrate epimerase
VLKGSGSLILGDRKLLRFAAGNPGMASGGMGQMSLSGVIGGLVAQGLSLYDAAEWGVRLPRRQ